MTVDPKTPAAAAPAAGAPDPAEEAAVLFPDIEVPVSDPDTRADPVAFEVGQLIFDV
ncbi:MAG: hypothetical protein OXC10_12245 [Rhodospirillaceae bacterium]|nr:hypothetical protein [Rhodospirillaceae bacterium]